MNGYEKIVIMMTNASKKSSNDEDDITSPLILGEMTAAKKCSIGDIILDEDDLLINEELEGELHAGDTVLLNRLDAEDFVILCKVKEI